jgi:hypothetical protein
MAIGLRAVDWGPHIRQPTTPQGRAARGNPSRSPISCRTLVPLIAFALTEQFGVLIFQAPRSTLVGMSEGDATDRYAIIELLSRYFSAVDDKRLDLASVEGSFSDDGRLARPNGSAMVGPQEILSGQNASFARFRATHHVITDHVVDVAGDTARVRANLIAMHLWEYEQSDPHSLETYFVAGGVLRALSTRTPAGWRLTELELRNVWRTGAGFGSMAHTGSAPPATS